VRDEGPGQTEYAWVTLKGTFRELGELAVESRRQILPNFSYDFVDNVEVVDEPLRGRRDRAFVSDHRGERSVTLKQNAPAVPYAGCEGASGLALRECTLAGDDARMLLESFGAEELSAYRVW
jgi:hypothetical protein